MKETYDKWERRVPLCPSHVSELLKSNKDIISKIIIKPATNRIFSDSEDIDAGAVVSKNLHEADIILGIKGVLKD